MKTGITVEVSRRCADPEWDEFLEKTPGACFKQASDWAMFKLKGGWSPIRILSKRDGSIVGGVQLLAKRTPISLKIANIPQGPVFRSCDPDVLNAVMSRLVEVARSEKICYLVIEPPPDCIPEKELGRWGFRVNCTVPSESANYVLDLSQGSDALLRRMRRTTRNNIRIAEDRGITVREARENDIDVFFRLLEATSCRRHFLIPRESYYQDLWRSLEPGKHIKMFMAEHEGEVLSSLLTIPFGDTVVVINLVWSGQKKWLRPNELLFWKAIDWSRVSGFRTFSFGGMNLSIAKALIAGSSPPPSLVNSNTRFILGFGGSIVLVPSRYEYVPIRLLGKLMESSNSILGRYNLLNTARLVLKF